jgi:hypothetical protein
MARRVCAGIFRRYLNLQSEYGRTHRTRSKGVKCVTKKRTVPYPPSKSEFGLTELKYVGRIVGKEGIKLDPKKITANQEWPKPSTVTAMRCFLGMTSYYQRFIQSYEKVVNPLTDTTKGSPKKREAVEWNES